jgi:hypothetical protein
MPFKELEKICEIREIIVAGRIRVFIREKVRANLPPVEAVILVADHSAPIAAGEPSLDERRRPAHTAQLQQAGVFEGFEICESERHKN